ncbi:hypothetical protein B0H11DRAFT_1858006 [Mycena galericulata]|nr:hypothetical protein B0H11DRAFT_1858006 [Mycena galericulata]
MDVDPETNLPRHVEDLWFEDGNIVIQAGNSQFRVYRGVLAARSSVFKDMLSVPQSPESELVDGCPLVRLTDSEMEVEVFLKALFLPEFFMPFPSATTFDVATGCLRLSHKYGVDYLRRRALVHLSSVYHSKLSTRDIAEHYLSDSHPVLPPNIMSLNWPFDEPGESHEIYAVEVFREVDALWLLPYAFYNLSWAFNRSKVDTDVFHGGDYIGIPIGLSMRDQESFLQGHAIQSHYAIKILSFLTDPFDIEGCTSPAECAIARFRAAGNIQDRVHQYLDDKIHWQKGHVNQYLDDTLNAWSEVGHWDMLESVCPICLAALKTEHEDARQEFWDKLPGIYGLPSWEELEKMKIAAIGADCISTVDLDFY